MSITSSVAAILIILIRALFKNKLPKWAIYAVWSIVLIRLLLPFSFSSSASLFSFISAKPKTSQSESSQNLSQIEFVEIARNSPKGELKMQVLPKDSVQPTKEEVHNIQETVSKSSNSADPVQIHMLIAACIWVTGALILLLSSSVFYISTKNRLKSAFIIKDNSTIEKCKEIVGINQNIKVYRSGAFNTPIVSGIIKPKIILPIDCDLDNEIELQHIITHELIHIKRFDTVFKMLSIIALSLHWFNPIVWASYLLCSKDMESSCDEKVLKLLGYDMRQSYANSLLSLAIKQNRIHVTAGLLAFGESNVKKRVKDIMRFKKTKTIAAIIAVLALVCAGLLLLSNPKNKNQELLLLNKELSLLENKDTVTAFTKDGKYEMSSKADLTKLFKVNKWKKKEQSSPIELSSDLWFKIDESHEIRFYGDEALAMISDNGEYRYYTIPKSVHSNIYNYISKNGHKITSEKITDPKILEEIWDDYIIDTIANVSNTQFFNSPQEIDPINIAGYCFNRYVAENGEGNLLKNDDVNGLLFPLKTANEYAKRYFNIDEIDVSHINKAYYNDAKKAFIMTSRGKWHTKYNEKNAWGIHLSDVEKNSDGTYKVTLLEYDDYKATRVGRTETYTLKERSDGSLYFVSGRRDWVNNNLVKVTGDCKKFEKIKGYNGDLGAITLVGEIDGKLLFCNGYNTVKDIVLMYVDKSNMEVIKSFVAAENVKSDKFCGLRIFGDNIVVKLNDKLIIVDKDLNSKKEKSISIPYKGNPHGLDVSSDLKRFVFSDDEGLKLMDSENHSVKLLIKSAKENAPSGEIPSVHLYPHFAADETKIVSTMSGYEWTNGIIVYDIQSGTMKKVIDSGDSTTYGVYWDSGILDVNGYERGTGKIKTFYLNFKTVAVTEIPIKNTGNTDFIRGGSMCYTGKNYAAFVTCKLDYEDEANSIYYISRLNLKTLELEPEIISVKAAQVCILGVTEDGQIIFYYNYNPSENGIAITAKP